jgi:hypothetical protein
MRIRENTPQKLVIEERPIAFAGIMAMFFLAVTYGVIDGWRGMEWPVRALLGGFAVGIPLLVRYFVHWVEAVLERATGRIEIARRGLLFEKREVYPLKHFIEARKQTSKDSDGEAYRVVLVFNEAMLSEIDPAQREKILSDKKRGLRSAAANEVPLTQY